MSKEMCNLENLEEKEEKTEGKEKETKKRKNQFKDVPSTVCSPEFPEGCMDIGGLDD